MIGRSDSLDDGWCLIGDDLEYDDLDLNTSLPDIVIGRFPRTSRMDRRGWLLLRRLDGSQIDLADPLGMVRERHINEMMSQTPARSQLGEDYVRGKRLILERRYVRMTLSSTYRGHSLLEDQLTGASVGGSSTFTRNSDVRPSWYEEPTVLRGVGGPFEYVVIRPLDEVRERDILLRSFSVSQTELLRGVSPVGKTPSTEGV